MNQQARTASQPGVAQALSHLFGFTTPSLPFPFATGPTSLRLRRMRDVRAKERLALVAREESNTPRRLKKLA